jgi:hypothetical protein
VDPHTTVHHYFEVLSSIPFLRPRLTLFRDNSTVSRNLIMAPLGIPALKAFWLLTAVALLTMDIGAEGAPAKKSKKPKWHPIDVRLPIDYMDVKTEKRVGELGGDIGANINRS